MEGDKTADIDASPAQNAGKLVGTPVELGVRHRFFTLNDSNATGSRCGNRREAPRDRLAKDIEIQGRDATICVNSHTFVEV